MQFSLKPVFVGWMTLVVQLPAQLFLTVWGGGFLGGLLTVTRLFPQNSFVPFLLAGGIPFVVTPTAIYVAKKYNYRRTEYKFFDDRLEFEEGFLTINKKALKFKDVREVTLRRGVLQRMCGLGTVYLATLATGTVSYSGGFPTFGFGNISASGIRLRDIANPEDMYARIKAIVDTHN